LLRSIVIEVRSREPEVGSRKPEVGSRKPEAGSRKPEAGSRKSEVKRNTMSELKTLQAEKKRYSINTFVTFIQNEMASSKFI
jgi:hypothetical protein